MKRSQIRTWDMFASSRANPNLVRNTIFQRDLAPVLSEDDFPNEGFTDARKEAVYSLKGALVMEPEYGYIIARPFSVMEEVLPGAEHIRKGLDNLDNLGAFSGYPSLRGYLSYKARRQPVRHEPRVISLCHAWGNNYYHFLHDNIARLRLIDQYVGDRSIPLVVDRKTAALPAFKELYQRGELKNRSWIVLDKTYLDVDEILYAYNCPGITEDLDYLLKIIDAPEADRASGRRLFIHRPTTDPTIKTGRFVSNMDALLPVLKEQGFEILNPGALSFQDQIKTFSEAAIVAGVHGAALTNIIFRRGQPMKLLEIFGPNDAPPQFSLLSRQFGYDYRYIRGENPTGKSRTASFEVNVEVFKNYLEDLIR